MSEYISCAICGFKSKSLRHHINREHGISAKEYKAQYASTIESEAVKAKRERTNIEKYGEAHYTNREAARFSYLVFEGGHPFSDPKCREKSLQTKEKRYGDPKYTNREKAKKTNLEKYGVEHTGASREVIRKRIQTLKKKYGKVFNIKEPSNKTHPPEGFKDDYIRGTLIEELSHKYRVSAITIKRWTRVLHISRDSSRSLSTERDLRSPEEIVSDYLDACSEVQKNLSFYEYGKLKGERYSNKLKRLFNKGKKYESLKESLFKVGFKKSDKCDFLNKMCTV